MKKKKLLIIIIFIIIFIVVIGSIFVNNMQKNLEKLSEMKIENIDLSRTKDGIFYGSYESQPVAAEVKVVIENKTIKSIELLKHNNGQGKAAEILTEKVVESQSLQVDIVSGATYSSKVILKAIEDALKKSVN